MNVVCLIIATTYVVAALFTPFLVKNIYLKFKLLGINRKYEIYTHALMIVQTHTYIYIYIYIYGNLVMYLRKSITNIKTKFADK